MSSTALKEERISIRTTPELKHVLMAAAAELNISMTDFLLAAGRKAAEQVLAESRRIVLSQQEWERFLDLLDNPPPPNQALRAAMARHHEPLD